MKRTTIIFFLFLFSLYSNAQTISFTKKVFKAGEMVTATVTGELKGVENGITNTSYSAVQGVLNLGKPGSPGFYRLDFIFSGNQVKSYMVGVIGQTEQTSEQYIIPLAEGKLSSVSPGVAEKMLSYFKKETSTASLLAVSKGGLNKFCRENAVALVSNVSFCITTVSGVPVVATICQSLTASNAKKLGIEVMKAFLTDMKVKSYLTEAEYKTILLAIDATQVGAILKSNCSLIFKSLKALSGDENLKIALGYFEQQCKTTVLIIDKFKPIP